VPWSGDGQKGITKMDLNALIVDDSAIRKILVIEKLLGRLKSAEGVSRA
jgi:hypothetical protein